MNAIPGDESLHHCETFRRSSQKLSDSTTSVISIGKYASKSSKKDCNLEREYEQRLVNRE